MSSTYPNVIPCNLCDVVYADQNDLHDHIIQFHDIETYRRSSSSFCCFMCGRAFSTVSSLNRHLREVHKENVGRVQPERTITCYFCQKKFATQQTLYKHVKVVHIKPEPLEFICSECGYICMSRLTIIRHLNSYHPFKEVSSDDPSPLATILPERYTYEVTKFKYLDDSKKSFYTRFTFEVGSLEEGRMWFDVFSKKNKLFVRPSKYRRSVKPHVLHKVKYCCRHNVAVNKPKKEVAKKLRKGARQTFCPWTFSIEINRVDRKKKKSDRIPRIVVKVQLRHNHNHDERYSLKFLKPTAEVQNTFLNLFKAGFTPSKARQIYINELKNEYEDQYSAIAEDSSIVPSLGWVYRFYSKKFTDQLKTSSLKCDFISTLNEHEMHEEIVT